MAAGNPRSLPRAPRWAREGTRQILIDVWGPVGRLIGDFNAAAPAIQARIDRLEQDRQQLLVVLEAMAEAVIAVERSGCCSPTPAPMASSGSTPPRSAGWSPS